VRESPCIHSQKKQRVHHGILPGSLRNVQGGGTPFDHIGTIRLSCAANRLKYENEKIIDVAFDFVFGSHETFTRAFSKQFGITPKLYEFFWAVEDGPIFQLEPLGIGDTSKLDRLGR